MQFIYSKRFKKEFTRLTFKIQNIAKERLAIFSQTQNHPILNKHYLSGEYSECQSINITGDYRIVFQMVSEEVCYLIAIGTHSKLYE